MTNHASRTSRLLEMLSRLGVNQNDVAKKLGITPGHLTRLKSGERSSDTQTLILEKMVDEEMRAVIRDYISFKRSEVQVTTGDWKAKANPALLYMSEADLVQLLGIVGESKEPTDQQFKDEILFILKNRRPGESQ